MSVEQAQRAVNQIDKEIADLEKKMADLVKKEVDKMKKIGDVQRSITKNTSQSTLNSKMRQIENYQKELSRILSDKATINQKLADKRKRRVDAAGKLQKEELEQDRPVIVGCDIFYCYWHANQRTARANRNVERGCKKRKKHI